MKKFLLYSGLFLFLVAGLILGLNLTLSHYEAGPLSPLVIPSVKGQTVVVFEGHRSDLKRMMEQPAACAVTLESASYPESMAGTHRLPGTWRIPSS